MNNTTALTELETRLRRLEWQNRVLISLVIGLAGIGSIAATNRPSRIAADEIRTSDFMIVDNHGTILRETRGFQGVLQTEDFPDHRAIWFPGVK
jgi:hypothetical protein